MFDVQQNQWAEFSLKIKAMDVILKGSKRVHV